MKGLWVIVEGPDNTGKTTLSQGLHDWAIDEYGLAPCLTREPGSVKDELCFEIRNLIMNFGHGDHDFFLFLADRIRHMDKVVVPYVNRCGVIQDRGMISTLVYQRGHFLNPKYICEDVAQMFKEKHNLKPPIVIHLTGDPKELSERQVENNKFDKGKGVQYFKELIKYYDQYVPLAKEWGLCSDVLTIDTTDYSKDLTLERAKEFIARKVMAQ